MKAMPPGKGALDDLAQPRRWQRTLAGIALFLVVAAVHKTSRVKQSGGDTVWYVATAESLLRDHDAAIDEYAGILEHNPTWAYGVRRIKGQLYTIFPIANAIVALPMVGLATALGIHHPGPETTGIKGAPGLEETIASLLVAITAVLLFQIVSRQAGWARGLAAAMIFAFCTPAWSTASRALWQHGPSMLALTLALALLQRLTKGQSAGAPRTALLLVGLGVTVAAAYTIRPTNAVTVLALTAYVFIRHRRQSGFYLAGAAVIAAGFLAFNLNLYDSLLPPYFWPTRITSSTTLSEALVGNLVSPARGLLVYSPVFALALVGAVMMLKKGHWQLLDCFLAAIVLGHWLVISCFPHWWGGWCYGPRLFSDVIPILILFMVPALSVKTARSWFFVAVVVAISFLMHARGASSAACGRWNFDPVSVEAAPDRLWDWSDPPFLRRS